MVTGLRADGVDLLGQPKPQPVFQNFTLLTMETQTAKNLLVYAVFPGQTGSGCSMSLGHSLTIHGLQ